MFRPLKLDVCAFGAIDHWRPYQGTEHENNMCLLRVYKTLTSGLKDADSCTKARQHSCLCETSENSSYWESHSFIMARFDAEVSVF